MPHIPFDCFNSTIKTVMNPLCNFDFCCCASLSENHYLCVGQQIQARHFIMTASTARSNKCCTRPFAKGEIQCVWEGGFWEILTIVRFICLLVGEGVGWYPQIIVWTTQKDEMDGSIALLGKTIMTMLEMSTSPSIRHSSKSSQQKTSLHPRHYMSQKVASNS